MSETARLQGRNWKTLGFRDDVVRWGTLSLINAGLAQSKNRSGLMWCLLSLVLGPFATFLIIVLDKVRLDGE